MTRDPLIHLAQQLAAATELAFNCEFVDVIKVDAASLPHDISKVTTAFDQIQLPCSALMAQQWDQVRLFAERNRKAEDVPETGKRIRLALAASWAALHSIRLCSQAIEAALAGAISPQQASAFPGRLEAKS